MPKLFSRLSSYATVPLSRYRRLSDEQKAYIADVDLTKGLTQAEALVRQAKWGKNVLPGKKRSPILLFLGFLWGPMPIGEAIFGACSP